MTREIYQKSEEITNVRQTISYMLDVLTTETKAQGKDAGCQVVLFLNKDDEGFEWKMFVYYDADTNDYRYSYQDQDYNDTDFIFHNSLEEVTKEMLDEIDHVGGFEGICVDF